MLDEGQHSLETSAEVEYRGYFRHNVTVNFDCIHFWLSSFSLYKLYSFWLTPLVHGQGHGHPNVWSRQMWLLQGGRWRRVSRHEWSQDTMTLPSSFQLCERGDTDQGETSPW